MRQLLQSTSRVVTFKAFLSSDHITAATGKTIAVTISKNGAAFGNPSAGATNATEISAGWYSVTLSTTDTNTIGDLIVRGAEGTIDPAESMCQVVTTASSAPTAAQIATEVYDQAAGVETNWTVREALRVMLAVLAGPTSGMGTTTAILKNPTGATNRVTMTVDVNGNRSSPSYVKT